MHRYTNVKVTVSEGQKSKIQKSLQAGTGVSIKLSRGDLSGEHVLALTQAQVTKMTNAYQAGTCMTIKMSKTKLEHNKRVEGGFIGAILQFAKFAKVQSITPTGVKQEGDLTDIL